MPLHVRDSDSQARADLVVVGHVTVDRFQAGHDRPGGSAFYSAALAVRCGLSVTLVTTGHPALIAAGLGALLDEIEVIVAPAERSTTLLTWFDGALRRQRVLAAAPPIAPLPVEADVLHLAPILREVGPAWVSTGGARLTALTPQGLVRHWDDDGDIRLAPSPGLAEFGVDVAVLSEHEVEPCAALLDATAAAGGTVVVTAAGGPAEVRIDGRAAFTVPAIPTTVQDEMGAGDVFAAALLVALRDGIPMREAVCFAHAAASLRLASTGLAAIPSRAQIAARARTSYPAPTGADSGTSSAPRSVG